MPNTLTTIFQSRPSTEPVEAPHPNTGVYTTGTQLADGTWSVVHTAITKTASPLTMVGRLKNFPAITASIVASGNILNNPQPAPTNTSATGSGATGISITGNSGANATAYRFFSGSAQAGPFTLLVTQASATYNQTGVTNGATLWYQMQYVGGGFYDDSPLSAAFSGTTAAAATNVLTPVTANYWNDGGLSRTSGSQTIHASGSQLRINLNGATTASLSLFNTGGGTTLATNAGNIVANISAGTSPSAYALSGLDGGTLTLTLGSDQRSYEVGDVQGPDVATITLPAGTVGNFLTPTPPSLQMAMLGDSISNGTGATIPQSKGWTSLFRNTVRSTSLFGYGSGQGLVAGSQATWPQLMAFLDNTLTGQAQQVIWWLYGSNDAMGASGGGADTLANCLAAFSNFLTNATTRYPSAKIIVLTPIFRVGEATANQFGWTLQQLRDGMVSAAAGKTNVTVTSGATILGASDLNADGAHPTDIGHQKMFNYLEPILNAVLGNQELLVAPTSLAAVPWALQPNTALVNGVISKTGGTQNEWYQGGSSSKMYGTTAGTGEKGRVHIDTTLVVRGSTKWGSVAIGLNTALPNWGSTAVYAPDPVTHNNVYITIGPSFYYDDVKFGLIENGAPAPFVTQNWANYAANPDLDIVLTDTKIKFFVAGKLFYSSSFTFTFPIYLSAVLASVADATYPVSQARVTYQGVNLLPVPAFAIANGPVTWANFRNEAVDTNGLLHSVSATALGGSATLGWNGGGSTTAALGAFAGTAEVGRLSFPGQTPAPGASGSWMAGLMSGPSYTGNISNASSEYYAKIQYALYRDNLVYRVFELGVKKFEATFPAGATYKLEVVVFNTYISYQRDGVEFYRNTTVPPTFPLYGEACFNTATNYATVGSYVSGVTIAAANIIASGY